MKFKATIEMMLILTSLLTSNFVVVASSTFLVPNVNALEQSQEILPSILILVEEDLYSKIQEKLAIFENDLENEGYKVSHFLVTKQSSPPEIKDIIKSYYLENNLIGVILIGNIKAAYSEIRTGDYSNPQALKIWISLDAVDMYYMDLDGHWENMTNPDFYKYMPPNVVETHLYPSTRTFINEYIVYLDETKKWNYNEIENKTQYQAEIWVSRIMAHNLNIPGKDEAQIINDFLDWDHKYRTQHQDISNKVYILNAIGSGYNDQNMNYSKIFNTIERKEYVTKNDYVACLEDDEGSKLIYLTAHSWSQGHVFYPSSLTVNELIYMNKSSIFYILNACSANRWDQFISTPYNPNYLGGVYVFSKEEDHRDFGLGSIGFTGVGGFNFLEFFTDYLNDNQNASYGEAYKYYFNKNLMHIFGIWNYVYLGDPTIGPKTPQLPKLPTIISELRAEIEELGIEGQIDNQGIVKSFLAKLDVAQKLVDKGKIDEAKTILEDDFIPQVQNLSGIHITIEATDILIKSTEYILSHL